MLFFVAACEARPPLPTEPTGLSPETFNGTYTGTATTTDFAFCGMQQSSQVRGVLNVDKSGKGTWTVTQVDRGLPIRASSVTLVVEGDIARFTTKGSDVINGIAFRLFEEAVTDGKAVNLSQLFVRVSSGCSYAYQARLSVAPPAP